MPPARKTVVDGIIGFPAITRWVSLGNAAEVMVGTFRFSQPENKITARIS